MTLRAYSTASGTTSVTINVPTGTADGDILLLGVLADVDDAAATTPGTWTASAVANGHQFRSFYRIWGTGDPTSVTLMMTGTSEMLATMLGFDAGSFSTSASIPSGGSDSTKIECPFFSTGSKQVAFGAIVNDAGPSGALSADSPLGLIIEQTSAHMNLVAGWDASATAGNRTFAGVTTTNPDSSIPRSELRAGIGIRIGTPSPPTVGWIWGEIRN